MAVIPSLSAKIGCTAETLKRWPRESQKAVNKSETEGNDFEKFTLHDMKRKGITDYRGNQMAASGHRSDTMMRVYDVNVPLVELKSLTRADLLTNHFSEIILSKLVSY